MEVMGVVEEDTERRGQKQVADFDSRPVSYKRTNEDLKNKLVND